MSTTTHNPLSTSATYLPTGYGVINMRLGREGGDSVDGGYVEEQRLTAETRFGYTFVVQTTDDTVSVTITLQGASDQARKCQRVVAQNEANKLLGIPPVSGPFELNTPSTGEVITIPEAFIANAPRSVIGEGRPVRAFTFIGGGSVTNPP